MLSFLLKFMLWTVTVCAFVAFLLKLLLATARILRLAGQLYMRLEKYLWLRSFYLCQVLVD